jgi:hypothetical protein
MMWRVLTHAFAKATGGEGPAYVPLPCAADAAGSSSNVAACHEGPKALLVENDPVFRLKLGQVIMTSPSKRVQHPFSNLHLSPLHGARRAPGVCH